RLARYRACRADRRARRADRATALSAPHAHRDLQVGGDDLSQLLFPAVENLLNPERDAPQPANDEAPPARGRGVLCVPQGTQDGLSKKEKGFFFEKKKQ